MKTSEIHDDREFYQAVHEYTTKVWHWGAHIDDDYDNEPTPDELIEMLNERIEWVKDHKLNRTGIKGRAGDTDSGNSVNAVRP